ncbi:MAG: sulfite exporter TauE/SafE family protein [Kangiellaceae bacterium]|jgi:uncharacterized membrane protein YfcA|nr:sulfite exporter TauE/SafE family protein [Kangiellaceae bacterium]
MVNMIYFAVSAASLAIAFLTMFSGFGLGSLLMPVFAMFFPITIAVASTAVVHALNNLFKIILLFSHIDSRVIVRFGVPAIIASLVGASLLLMLAQVNAEIVWSMLGEEFSTSLIKLVLGLLILSFAIFDLLNIKNTINFRDRWLPIGGILSGFFGGLSGHQGAFRSMFLIHVDLSPKQYIATQSGIALLVDISRIAIYFYGYWLAENTREQQLEDAFAIDWQLISFATLFAFVGTFVAKRMLEKTKIKTVQWVAGIFLIFIGCNLISGLI